MGKFDVKLKRLYTDFKIYVAKKVVKTGIYTGASIEKGLLIPKGKDFYVDGRRITHITENILIADGYHFEYSCMDAFELCELMNSL